MLTRIVSGLVMGIAVILAVFYTSPMVFNTILLVLMLAGLYEWKRLCGTNNASYFLGAAGLIALFIFHSLGYLSNMMNFSLLGLGVGLWLSNTITLTKPIDKPNAFCLLIGVVTLGLAWLGMVVLRNQFGQHTLMLVFLMVWSADTFAYFGGKKFGKTKLAPAISPGKTREGVASGVLMAMFVAVCYAHFFITPIVTFSQMLILLIITMLVALISVVGDLSESKLKRAANMKDSSNLIPGHGGILDRIDGLIAGVVIYAFYAILAKNVL